MSQNTPISRNSPALARLLSSERVSLFGGAMARPTDIIALSTGDPDLPTPSWICEAAIEAMQGGYTHYPPVQGDFELRDAVAQQLNEQHGQSYSVDDVLITSGATSAVYAAIAALVGPGDEVVMLDPCYSLYEDAVKTVNGVCVRARMNDRFHLDAEALERAVSPRCKLIVLNTPCNPTATLLSRAELEAVERIAAERDLFVLSDEVYDHIVFDGRQFISAVDLPELAERTVLVQSFSKTFAMTGWRVGFVAAKGGWSRQAAALHWTTTGQVNYIAQRAALAGLRASHATVDAWHRETQTVYERRRLLGQALLEKIPRVHARLPEATFYYWLKVETEMTSAELTRYLREVGRVTVRCGTEFGPAGEGYIRLTFAVSDEQFRDGILRIGEALDRLDR
ncbi:MAG: aminotransferase class I/II-fold pyridoxal phosphate-dependent enzyme [Chloroflexi bacterium]|nr:aminotransferase class I/II-fold pyridoxal phosphate-dependent enzyme [Chloroflexota bacterium]